MSDRIKFYQENVQLNEKEIAQKNKIKKINVDSNEVKE